MAGTRVPLWGRVQNFLFEGTRSGFFLLGGPANIGVPETQTRQEKPTQKKASEPEVLPWAPA